MGQNEGTEMPAPGDTAEPLPPEQAQETISPESAAPAEAAAAAPSPPLDPVFSSRVEVPARPENTHESGGGEWDLLTEKIRSWASADSFKSFWSRWRTPVRVAGVLFILIIVLRIYSGLIGTIESVPLAPGLFELAGLVWLINFALNNLIKSSDRNKVKSGLQNRWRSITGR